MAFRGKNRQKWTLKRRKWERVGKEHPKPRGAVLLGRSCATGEQTQPGHGPSFGLQALLRLNVVQAYLSRHVPSSDEFVPALVPEFFSQTSVLTCKSWLLQCCTHMRSSSVESYRPFVHCHTEAGAVESGSAPFCQGWVTCGGAMTTG